MGLVDCKGKVGVEGYRCGKFNMEVTYFHDGGIHHKEGSR